MNNFEQELIERMIHYQTNPVAHWVSTNEKDVTNEWYNAVYDHLVKTALPHIKQTGENYVEYWPARILWGTRSGVEQNIFDRQIINKTMEGAYGTGYICLTDKKVYIFSFAQWTKRFPMIKKDLTSFFLRALVQEMDYTRPCNEDRHWIISNDTILGA